MKLGTKWIRTLALGLCFAMLTGCSWGRTEQAAPAGNEAREPVSAETENKVREPVTAEAENRISETIKAGDADRVSELLKTMTLEEKVGQMMIPSFRIWQDLRNAPEGNETGAEKTNITELNDEIRACLEKNHFGGTLLFAENFKDAEQTYRLVRDLQASNQKGSSIPLFVSADQEGGTVTRIGFGTSGIGNMALAATGDPENAKVMAAIHGEELKALGINMDFAPVVDINNNPATSVIGVRSFSDDPYETSKYVAAFMEGLTGTGTIATLKHFPGHGDTDIDSHTGFPLINKSLDELKAFELVPYQEAVKNGAEMIMTAHIQYPQIEKETYVSVSTGKEVYLPATMSRVLLTDVLKGDMGFGGVIVTDALDMAAITDHFAFEDVLRMTISAGADMLILPVIRNTDLFEQTDGVVEQTVRLVREGRISEERIDDAVMRILKLKEKHGILDPGEFAVSDAEITNAEQTVGSPENRDQAWKLAEQALTLLRNENHSYPLSAAEGEETLILFADSCASRAGYGKLAKQMLNDDGINGITVMVHQADNGAECVKAAAEADHVILISRAYNAACLDPETGDGFSTAVFDEIIAKRHQDGKTVIVISCQLPYDAARFPDADCVILTYCSSVLRDLPRESGEGSAYTPNLAAAIVSCFKGGTLSGRLPVDLPGLDENYQLTKDILYQRGYQYISDAAGSRKEPASMTYAEFQALDPEERKQAFAAMTGEEIYELVKNSDENWPVTSYDRITPGNARETVILFDNHGDLHFNLAWPCYGGFLPESIASLGDLSGSVDVSRDGGDGGYSISYGKNEDGSYPNDAQRSVPKTSAVVRTGIFEVDPYKKVVEVVTDGESEEKRLKELSKLGYSEEIAERFLKDQAAWLKRDEVSGPENVGDGALAAGHTVESRYGYYGVTAPWKAGDLDLEGGGGQMLPVFSWGTLCASGLIHDVGTAEIR